MNKRAQVSFETIFLGIVRMVEYIILFFVLIAIINLLIISKVETGKAESSAYLSRTLYSAIAYQDAETDRIYPGIIDNNKLDSTYLSKKMSNGQTALKINTEQKEATYNELQYRYLEPLAQSGLPGKGAVATTTELRLLQENGQETKTIIKVVSPK